MSVWQKLLSYFPELVKGNSGATPTVDWSKGSAQSMTLTAGTVTPTFVNPPGGANLTLVLTQDGTGGRNVVWPAAFSWIGGGPPLLQSGPGQTSLITFYFDGTTYFGTLATAGTPSSSARVRTLWTISHSWGIGNAQPSVYDGFRTQIDHRLRALGRPVRFIGTLFNQRTDQTYPPSPTVDVDWMTYGWHECHGGETFAAAAAALPARLATVLAQGQGSPDFAVVLLGANDAAVYGTDIFNGTLTQPQALALMQAGLTSIHDQLIAAGVSRIFVTDTAHLALPSVGAPILPDANALVDAWNALLPSLIAGLPGAVLVTGLITITSADYLLNGVASGHPNRRSSTFIGNLLAEAIAPYVEPAPSGQWPRPRLVRGPAATPRMQVVTPATDGVTLNLAGLKPPGAGSFLAMVDYTPTSLPAGVHNIMQYADAVANGFAIQTNGSNLQANLSGAAILVNIALEVGVPLRIALWADAASGWVSLIVNGIVVQSFQLGDIWNIAVQQNMYWGLVTPAATPGAPGIYSRSEMHYGASLPGFKDIVAWAEADGRETARIPGLTAEVLFSEGVGQPAESLTGTLATLVGGMAWVAAGVFPSPWEDASGVLEDGQPLGNVLTLTVGNSAPAAGLAVDFTAAASGMRFPSLTYAQILALVNPPSGTVYHATDASLNVDLYNAGTPAAPVWRPVGGGVVASELQGFVSSTNFYQGPAATGTGVTAAAGTWTVILRRNTNFTVPVDEIFGNTSAGFAAGAMLILQNATTPNDTYSADVTNVLQSQNIVSYWQSVLNANVTTGTANGARGNLMVLSFVFGVGTSILYVNGVPGSVATTAGYSEAGVRVCLGGLGIDGSFAFADGGIVGVAVSTTSLSASQIQAIVSDVGRLGPEGALLNSPALTYAYLAKNAGATLASVVASGGAGGGGPLLTRHGALSTVPFVAPAWALAA